MKPFDFSRSAPQPLAAVRYPVKWTAAATAGHRTQGAYAFTVQ
jgi:methionine-rich copper-binding protein CopC